MKSANLVSNLSEIDEKDFHGPSGTLIHLDSRGMAYHLLLLSFYILRKYNRILNTLLKCGMDACK